MLGPDHIRSLLRDALRNLHLGDADIYLTATTQALTRFANNRIQRTCTTTMLWRTFASLTRNVRVAL